MTVGLFNLTYYEKVKLKRMLLVKIYEFNIKYSC